MSRHQQTDREQPELTISSAVRRAVNEWKSQDYIGDKPSLEDMRDMVDELVDNEFIDIEEEERLLNGIRLVEGDDLWEGAQAGWYVFKDGDSTGPFESETEAQKFSEESSQ